MDPLQRALSLHQQGMLDAAYDAYLAILRRSPKDINALNFLGVLCFQRGQVPEGVKHLRKCLQLRPDFAQAHNNLGNGLMQAGNLKEAIPCFSRAVALSPNYAEAHHNLANAYGKQKAFEKALQSATRAVGYAPGFPAAWASLAAAHFGLDHHQEALDACERALQLSPGLADAALIKARVLWGLGHRLDSVAAYRLAIDKYRNDDEVLREFGLRLLVAGRPDEALQYLERAVELAPGDVAGLIRLGMAYDGERRYEEAESCFGKALALCPDSGEAHFHLSKTLRVQRKYQAAEVMARRAAELDPESSLYSFHLATLLADVDCPDDAHALLEALKSKDPDNADALSFALYLSNYSGRYSSEQRYRMALEYGRIVRDKADPRCDWVVNQQPTRLKIGLVSGDLQTHPVGLFLASILPELDQGRLELVAYPTHRSVDELSMRLIPHFSAWKPLSGLDDRAAAEMIRSDGVHVLIDLSGHTADNRLSLFAWKPAPVQASWLGYFATTGVGEIDYFIADEASAPPRLAGQFCERLWYLPDTRMCFSPPDLALEAGALPALTNAYVTFGSFQNAMKLQAPVLEAWAEILARMPTARLRVQSLSFKEPAAVEAFRERFRGIGGDAARLSLLGPVAREDYLAAHREVDMILDTFPFPGGTTTCEALWMGVPTLTLAGESLIARQGASFMTAAGFPEWVASDKAEYVEKALLFAADLQRLASLRREMRARVLASPLFDARRFSRNLETALWSMWNARQDRGGEPAAAGGAP